MSNTEGVRFSLNVMTNKQKNKVFYAEADSDFTDVLLSFLTLPLGTIVRILGKHYGDEAPVVGSLTTLYNSLSNLNSDLFCTESGKQMLLNPRKSFLNERCKLKLNIDDTPLTKSYKCADIDCSTKKTRNMGLYYDTCKCDCGKSALSKDIGILDDLDFGVVDGGVFTKTTASFIISDDLHIFPSETGYAIRILTGLGITGTDEDTELMDVSFGFNEVMDLLKGSLLSQTPLTDIILNKGKSNCFTNKCDTCIVPASQTDKQRSSSNDNKILRVKAIIQESTNRLLLVEASGDFVDFLFTLFTIPLGAVECLLGGSTALLNIDNLYKSLKNINDDKYLKTQDAEEMLLEPEIPTGYVSKDKILPLIEEIRDFYLGGVLSASAKSPKGPGNYVKEQKMYMVTDDLTVTPLNTASSISIISRLKVPLSDIKELELEIGLNEALSILKASLTSTSALSDGLKIKPSIRKKPKQEHAMS